MTLLASRAWARNAFAASVRGLGRDPAPWSAALFTAAAMVAYVYGSLAGVASPRTTFGLGFGVAATVALGVVMLYTGRRSLPQVRILGRTSRYLKIHLYGGALFLLLVLMHTAFRTPQGILAWWLWVLSLWVVTTGVAGLALQRWIPRLLDSGLSLEVNLQRIPELVDETRVRAEHAARGAGEAVRSFYASELAPLMAAPRPRVAEGLGLRGSGPGRVREFERLRTTLSGEARSSLDELQRLYRVKLEMDSHYGLQRILRGWLWLHVPTAVVLVALLVLHIFFALYF